MFKEYTRSGMIRRVLLQRSFRIALLGLVARASGVSRATVSYVLNNDPRQSIPAETRERVLKAVVRDHDLPHFLNAFATRIETLYPAERSAHFQFSQVCFANGSNPSILIVRIAMPVTIPCVFAVRGWKGRRRFVSALCSQSAHTPSDQEG